MNKLKKLLQSLLDIPDHKVEYLIHSHELVNGLWGNINAYGIPFSKENHEILIEYIQDRLEGPDIEREWSEDEYYNFVLYNGEK